jgi:hypothetical protein
MNFATNSIYVMHGLCNELCNFVMYCMLLFYWTLEINGEEFKLRAKTSIVICTIPYILSCYGMHEFIKM